VILRLGSGSGAFSHRINSAGVAIDVQSIVDQAGIPYQKKITWSINFRLINTTTDPASLDAEIAAIETAYASTWPSVALLHNNGAATEHEISSGIVGEVRTTKLPSYARYQNGEYVSYRTGDVVIEALVAIVSLTGYVVEHTYNIEFSGGGPEYAFLQPNTGLPIKQQTRTNTPFRATQSGRIVHYDGFGALPAPIWSDHLVEAGKRSLGNPQRIGSVEFNFPQTYSYTYASATALALP
jgi:hypothetical protein